MNYHHLERKPSANVAQLVVSAAQQKKSVDAERIEQLNRLTRYPSLAALFVTGVALISAAIHVIR